MKTINDFIQELQSISPAKRELPLVIDCQNGLQVEPIVKMRWDDQYTIISQQPDKMVITHH
jgi:hypothetical protein